MNLPTTQGEWEIANSFFHSELPISEVNKDNLNNVTEKFNRIVYDYFHDNYGTAEKGFDKENDLQVKYKDYSKSQLRKELKRLKHSKTDTDVVTIRFVAKLLRSKVNSENTNCFKDKINLIDHDKEIKKNFWGYVKEFIKKPNQNPAKLQQRNLHKLLLQNVKDNETPKKLRNSRVDSKI